MQIIFSHCAIALLAALLRFCLPLCFPPRRIRGGDTCGRGGCNSGRGLGRSGIDRLALVLSGRLCLCQLCSQPACLSLRLFDIELLSPELCCGPIARLTGSSQSCGLFNEGALLPHDLASCRHSGGRSTARNSGLLINAVWKIQRDGGATSALA